MEGIRKFLAVENSIDADGVGDLFENSWEFLKEKASELLHLLLDFFGSLGKKADEIFPPETREETLRRWTHIGLTVVLPVALVLLCLYCCCCRRGRAAGRMMVAPGRRGLRMPRANFESNPAGYFRDLHAGKPLLY